MSPFLFPGSNLKIQTCERGEQGIYYVIFANRSTAFVKLSIVLSASP